LGLADVEWEQELLFSQSARDGAEIGESHVQRIGAFIEEPEEDWQAGNADSDSSLDSDSDYDEEERIGGYFENSPWPNEEAPDFDRYDRSQLHLWPVGWPILPIEVPPDDIQCDLCTERWCHCIILKLPKNKPRITREGLEGPGLHAIGVEGEMGYRKGQVLGELVSLDAYDDGWTMEFTRRDFDNQPVTQMYAKEMGNWVRKVSHSCKHSAEFRVMKISGWWRQMLVATRNIQQHGEVSAHCHCGHCE
jgi:hypothetical protein